LLSEGYAMLRGLTEDFKASGNEVTVLLDSRIAEFNPPLLADHVVQIACSQEADPNMERAAETADAAYVIAPEPNHVLQSIVECIETTGTLSLNCQATGIELASDKALLGKRIRSLGLDFPKTEILQNSDPNEKIAQFVGDKLGFPAVIKPANGAGCGGLSLAQNEKQIAEAIGKVKQETASTNVIAQEFIEGIPVSVSILSTGAEALPVSLNLQDITLATPCEDSTYNGGLVPFEHPLRDEAFSAAKRLVESFGYLRGYVGVDMVLTKDKAFVIEINSRLTTSYVGLRKVTYFNLAEAIIKAVVKNELPKNALTKGYSCFSKMPFSSSVSRVWRDICGVNEVVSPPFPLDSDGLTYALVGSQGDNFGEALLGLREAKAHLLRICQGGK
jgi:tyramine---L-glutamate ligase